jgi:hypothetical protein
MNIQVLQIEPAGHTDGVPRWEARLALTGEDDSEGFGQGEVFQALGLTSFPWPKDDTGSAEGLAVDGEFGRSLMIGGRDTRNAAIVGNGKPGDTILHTTGPNLSAQVQLKEQERIASMIALDQDGEHIVLTLDGVNKTLQLLAYGYVIQISDAGGLSMGTDKANITIQDDSIVLNGKVVLPGIPKGHYVMCGPAPASPGGVGTIPMQAALNVGGI